MLRLSFSRAEVALINSWNHTQQVVYHMLRYFAKEELMRKKWEREDKILCNDRIKTLMLWTSETNDKKFWDGHVVDICCIVLGTLCDRLREKTCPNYFVPSSNLFVDIQNEKNLREVLAKLENFQNNRELSYWFIENYIQRSAVLIAILSSETFRLTFSNSVGFQEFISGAFGVTIDPENVVLSYRKQQEQVDYSYSIMMFSNNLKKFSYFTEEFRQSQQAFCLARKDACAVGKRFAEYVTAMQLLNLSKQLVCFAIPFDGYEVFDYVGTLYKQFEVHSFPSRYSQNLSNFRLYFIKAQELMSGLQGEVSSVEVQLLERLSIACLQKSLSFQDPDRDFCSFRSTVIYLAALHYSAAEYYIAAELCSGIVIEQKEDRNCKRKNHKHVSGRLLLFIDDVANIFGFLILLRYAKRRPTKVLRMRELRFTSRAFAHYLLTVCYSENSRESAVWSKQEMNIPDQCLLATSLYRVKSPKFGQFVAESTQCSHSDDCFSLTNEELRNSLMDAYFTKLTRTFKLVRNDFEPECISDVLLRALYLYRCRRYDEVLPLCTQLENSTIALYHTQMCPICSNTLSISFAGPIDLFLDDDIQIVDGLGKLLKVVCGRCPFLVYADVNDANLPPNYLHYERSIEENFWKNEKISMQRRFLA